MRSLRNFLFQEKTRRDPAVKLTAALSAEKLAMVGMKKPPTDSAEIPDYLYQEGSKMHEAAKIIIFEGIKDVQKLVKHTGLSPKSISNVKSQIKKTAMEILRNREKLSGKTRDQGQIGDAANDELMVRGSWDIRDDSSRRIVDNTSIDSANQPGISSPPTAPPHPSITTSPSSTATQRRMLS